MFKIKVANSKYFMKKVKIILKYNKIVLTNTMHYCIICIRYAMTAWVIYYCIMAYIVYYEILLGSKIVFYEFICIRSAAMLLVYMISCLSAVRVFVID